MALMQAEDKFSRVTTILDSSFPIPENIVSFGCGGKEILRLDEKGMTYNGQFIEDAGEAHKAFIETMQIVKDNYWLRNQE